jgi:ABC-2 type transport system ATP-binding protein
LAEGLVKVYGKARALDGMDLVVERGTVMAVLGPNGAGKTTLIRVLATLTQPNQGRAFVAGFDVVAHPKEVQRRIGIAGQYATVDEYLTGKQNLVMIGQLCRLSRQQAISRADELLEQFDLKDASGRTTRTYSGGMRRKLDLAASLVIRPEVLFLDEPTTGLDPRARMGMWEVIRELGRGGTTLLLTTQYLEEADQLAHRIAVVDAGKVIAVGTPDELKATAGEAVLELTLPDGTNLEQAARLLTGICTGSVTTDPQRRRISLPAAEESGLVTKAVLALDSGGIRVDEITMRRPALDDVFMTLTGHHSEDVAEEAA